MLRFLCRRQRLPNMGARILRASTLAFALAVVARGQQPDAQQKNNASGASTETSQTPEQQKVPPAIDPGDTDSTPEYGLESLAKDFWGDQKEIWTSPARLRFADADWLIPTAGIAAGLFSTDKDISRHLSNNPTTISHYKTISNAGIAALAGGAGGMWLLSFSNHNAHWREAGFLAGEAALDSVVPAEILKYSLRRDRPYQGDGTGQFFQSGGTSFPSEHATAAWAVAGVLAHEYPGTFPKLMFYGLASLVSAARIKGKQHFPADVFVGSLMGNMIAQNVYSRHHDPDLGGDAWRSIGQIVRNDGDLPVSSMGSPYVPLDSWVYEALDRLAGMGVIDAAYVGLRPWTRLECARLVGEAADHAADRGAEVSRYVAALQQEFHYEMNDLEGEHNDIFRVESVYTRTEHISAAPLTDGYTFGQTQINDFGRPYGEGWNNVTGTSLYMTHGRWVGYARGEFQAAPEIPALSLSAREAVEVADHYPSLPPGTPQPAKDNFTLLDAYFGLMLSNWEITFGRQSLWWGPGDGGPMMLSDNIQPINMLRIARTTPLEAAELLGMVRPSPHRVFHRAAAGIQLCIRSNRFCGGFLSRAYA